MAPAVLFLSLAAAVGITPVALLASSGRASAAGSQTLYVALSGTGTTCTSSTPCSTIQQAVTLAETTYSADAVTIDVAAGDYTGAAEAFQIAVTQPLTIAGAGASMTTIDVQGNGTVAIVRNPNPAVAAAAVRIVGLFPASPLVAMSVDVHSTR